MGEKQRIARNTLTLVVVEAVWLLVSSGVLPLTETSAPIRALKIVLALGLALGLIPGMFLNTWILRLSKQATVARRGPLLFAGLIIPFIIFVLFLALMVVDLGFLSSARELGLGAESTSRRLIRNCGTILVWLATMILNALTIRASRRLAGTSEGPGH